MPSGVRKTKVKSSFTRTLKSTHTSAFKALRELVDNAKAVRSHWNASNVHVDLRERPEWGLKVRRGVLCALAFARSQPALGRPGLRRRGAHDCGRRRGMSRPGGVHFAGP